MVKIDAFVYSLKVVDKTKSDWLFAYLIDSGDTSLPGDTTVGFKKFSICKEIKMASLRTELVEQTVGHLEYDKQT